MVSVGAIIQVRLGSERLPNKALLPLPFGHGTTLLQHVVSHAAAARSIATVIVATSENPADDAIHAFCQDKHIHCFRGSQEDVLARFNAAAQKYELDVVVRLTGDNPFIMPDIIDNAIEKHRAAGVGYTITEGLPLGTNIEVVSYPALKKATSMATEAADREHVTPYIRRDKDIKKQIIAFSSPLNNLRLTIDYPSDYALANLLYDKLYEANELFGFTDIEALLAEHNWLAHVNPQNQQRQAFASERDEMESAVKTLKEGGYTRVLHKLQEVLK